MPSIRAPRRISQLHEAGARHANRGTWAPRVIRGSRLQALATPARALRHAQGCADGAVHRDLMLRTCANRGGHDLL